MPSTLFSPLVWRGVTLANRVVVAPMCQYSAQDGCMTDWHLMHLGQLALGGAGLLIVEATGVEPEGRITAGCTGLWNDAQEESFARVMALCRSVSPAKLGLQLGHAGRKGSSLRPWQGTGVETGPEGWTPVAPSAVPLTEGAAPPKALDDAGIARIVEAFGAAAARAARLGFDYLEIHAAHGYLLHQFLSPLSNQRTDRFGGSLENRLRMPLACFAAARAAFPEDRPVTVRVSATDWIEGGWDIDQTVAFAEALKGLGCDAIHVSSGGLRGDQRLVPGPGYQTGLAAEIRRRTGMPTIAVGMITEPAQAETILRTGQADMVALARGLLADPRWVWRAAIALGEPASVPVQYLRGAPGLKAMPFPPQ